jgi:ribosome-binding factor A
VNRRSEQVASTLRRAIQEVISRGLHDPRISGLITVTGVSLDAALREATVRISVLPEDRQELVLHGLQAAAGHIRHEIADLVEGRQTPHLHFKLDASLKKEASVLRALALAEEERRARVANAPNPAAGESAPTPETTGDHAP